MPQAVLDFARRRALRSGRMRIAREAADPRAARSSFASWTVLFLGLALMAYVRVHLRDIPLERDEGEYAYVGRLLLEGVAPYSVACNMKFPGPYAAYAAILA